MSGVLFAQQDPHFTQYFENTLFVNPAYAGSRGALNITSVHREQWTGFDGRPQSSTLSIHSPMKNESVGLGLTLVNDAIGPMNQTMVYGDYSFTLKFSEKSHLALGMKAGVNLINLNTQELTTIRQMTQTFRAVQILESILILDLELITILNIFLPVLVFLNCWKEATAIWMTQIGVLNNGIITRF